MPAKSVQTYIRSDVRRLCEHNGIADSQVRVRFTNALASHHSGHWSYTEGKYYKYRTWEPPFPGCVPFSVLTFGLEGLRHWYTWGYEEMSSLRRYMSSIPRKGYDAISQLVRHEFAHLLVWHHQERRKGSIHGRTFCKYYSKLLADWEESEVELSDNRGKSGASALVALSFQKGDRKMATSREMTKLSVARGDKVNRSLTIFNLLGFAGAMDDQTILKNVLRVDDTATVQNVQWSLYQLRNSGNVVKQDDGTWKAV